MKIYVGLDLGVNKTALCCIDENGDRLLRAIVPSEPGRIIAKLRTLPNPVTMIGLEACPLSEWIYGALVDEEYETYCLETRHTQRFLSSRPNMTDRTDARGIAEMMRIGHFKSVHVKSEESQIMRAILMGRKQFMTSMLQIENTLRGLLRIRGLKLGKVHRLKFSAKVMELCEDAPELLPTIEPLLEHRTILMTLDRRANADESRAIVTRMGQDPASNQRREAWLKASKLAENRARSRNARLSQKGCQKDR